MQARLESSSLGRALISFAVVVTLAAIVVTNLPAGSETRDRLIGLAQPYLLATGLDQSWAVFAPNPYDSAAYVESTVEYADGSTSTTRIDPGTGLDAYRDYRWHKFAEKLRHDDSEHLWAPLAAHVVRTASDDGRVPVRITLARVVSPTLPPGPGPERGPWVTTPFFTMEVGSG